MKLIKSVKGMTLIEVTIYVTLLSILLFVYMRSFYSLSDTDMKNFDNIHYFYNRENSKGFIAIVAVLMLAVAYSLVSTVIVYAAYSYTDSVMRREVRMQARLNVKSCLDHVGLMLERDFSLRGEVRVPEFDCHVSIKDGAGDILRINAQSGESGVFVYGDELVMLNNQSVAWFNRDVY